MDIDFFCYIKRYSEAARKVATVNIIIMRTLFITLLLLECCAVAGAQKVEPDIKYRLAESYDRSGDYESAMKLYEQLFTKDSTNMVIFDALRRDYLQLKRYDEAIALIQTMLRASPNDLGLLVQLGSTYVLKSDEAKATEAWDRAIGVDPKRETTYRLVASTMMQSRLFERAIATYQRGRMVMGDPNLFSADIAYLYGVTLNYTEATREYLKMLHQNPSQLGFVQSRIAMYTGRTSGLTAATQVVEEAVKTDANNLSLHQLLAWMYMEGKKFDKAYTVIKFIDSKTNAGGHELCNFAERALRERAYDAASKAFQEVMSTFPMFDRAAQVKFGYARTLEESDAETDTLKLFGGTNPFPEHPESESKPLFTGAIAAYHRVVTQYPNTEIAGRSLLRIATLKQEKFFDLDGARSVLESLAKQYVQFPSVISEATLRLGDVYVALGNLTLAEEQYQALAGTSPVFSEQKEKATLRLAELNYFQNRFQDALSKLKGLTTNARSDVTNDALTLQIFILENLKPSDVALKEFAKADLLQRQHKYSEALQVFESTVKSFPKSDVIDETLINIGDVYTQMARYADAIAAYDRLLKEFPESIFLDRTLMKIGQVYQLGLKEKPKAIETYQQLLEKYPNSIYVTEARRRVRELRGDNI
ncbi:MAG: tetratricopeptide repeat protein [Ignavibacteria bacterium]|nr:tetratricopeptide repeat protein [Ignavibacteria bacterium]MBI3766164.1 tetratricopeptide repeat protein [Ignavibacteriales bacterium]